MSVESRQEFLVQELACKEEGHNRRAWAWLRGTATPAAGGSFASVRGTRVETNIGRFPFYRMRGSDDFPVCRTRGDGEEGNEKVIVNHGADFGREGEE